MLAEHRQREILVRLDADGAVRVIDLAAELGVTEETIRRDLAKLHRCGRLLRTHGGAVVDDSRRREIPFKIRQAENLVLKEAIAAEAATLVKEQAVIVLDASTTVLELARVLPDRPLTVLTNSLAVARVLSDRTKVRVVLTGGEFEPTSLSLTGAVALQTLARFNISQAFLSCSGVDLERGLSEASDPPAQFKQLLLELAEHTYLLADHSKFGTRSVVFFGKLQQLEAIVTDDQTSENITRRLASAGVSVIQASDPKVKQKRFVAKEQ